MSNKIKMISLFTGIGGFDIAAQALDWDILFQSEIDPFCLKLLDQNFPNIKKYGDIHAVKAKKYRTVDVLVGGFPCQPFSIAGHMLGTNDPRHLWPEMFRVICECKPKFVIAENVYGIISNSKGMVFEQVCVDLESEGYSVQPYIIPAAGKNSFQERKRVWFIACLNSLGVAENAIETGKHFEAYFQNKKQLPDRPYFESWVQSVRHYAQLDGMVYGIPDWMDRTKALGNAIDPRIAYEILLVIDYLINHLKNN